MDKPKNLCLIQYTHSINFKKRPIDQQKNILSQKIIIPRDLNSPFGNKENIIKTASANKLNLLEPKTSRSSVSPRVSSLEEKIENLSFKNRNLHQVIRIREQKLNSELLEKKIEFNSGISKFKSEIELLESRKSSLIARQNYLKNEGLSKILNENTSLNNEIESMTSKISLIKSTYIDLMFYSHLLEKVQSLEQSESESLNTGNELRLTLSSLKKSNSESSETQIYFQQRQQLLEILCTVSKLKFIIINIIDKKAFNIKELENLNKKVKSLNFKSIIEKILAKSKALRMIVADKFAEEYTEGCKVN